MTYRLVLFDASIPPSWADCSDMFKIAYSLTHLITRFYSGKRKKNAFNCHVYLVVNGTEVCSRVKDKLGLFRRAVLRASAEHISLYM
jgi:hypothetical protein